MLMLMQRRLGWPPDRCIGGLWPQEGCILLEWRRDIFTLHACAASRSLPWQLALGLLEGQHAMHAAD
jgi:hypothetical protein